MVVADAERTPSNEMAAIHGSWVVKDRKSGANKESRPGMVCACMVSSVKAQAGLKCRRWNRFQWITSRMGGKGLTHGMDDELSYGRSFMTSFQ